MRRGFGEKTVHKSYERAPPEVTCFGGPMGAKSWNVLGSSAFSSRYQQLKNYYFWDLIKVSKAVYLSSNSAKLIPSPRYSDQGLRLFIAEINNRGDNE